MPTWLIVVLAVVGVIALFYTYVWAEQKLRMRKNAKIFRKMMKDLGM